MRNAALFALVVTLSRPVLAQSSASASRPYCSGEYADDLSMLSDRARQLDDKAYSVCVRNSVTYECLSYDSDGNVQRTRRKAMQHGTAFGFRQQNGETLLLTNEHVAEWPAVTDRDHTVDGVPAGCKRVGESMKIVDNEADDYDRDDIPLQRVVVDRQLDVAVIKAKALLPIMPWKIGRSASLRARNVVEVHGFPLGEFAATNVGKVISAYDHDSYKEWDHDDFVIDALLSAGNSGSPVLAVSCATGEFELVGIYHAGYTEGSALNLVVAIDQLRDFMTTLKRSPRGHKASLVLDAAARQRLAGMTRTSVDSFFPFGPLTASVRTRGDGALVFVVYSSRFPFSTRPIFAYEDLADASGFGSAGQAWFGGARGLKRYARAGLDAESQGQLLRAIDALRRDALAFFDYRQGAPAGDVTHDQFQQRARLQRTLERTVEEQRSLAQELQEAADRLAPRANDPLEQLGDVLGAASANPAIAPPTAPKVPAAPSP